MSWFGGESTLPPDNNRSKLGGGLVKPFQGASHGLPVSYQACILLDMLALDQTVVTDTLGARVTTWGLPLGVWRTMKMAPMLSVFDLVGVGGACGVFDDVFGEVYSIGSGGDSEYLVVDTTEDGT